MSVGWLLFKLPSFQDAVRYLLAIWNNTRLLTSPGAILNILIYSLPVLCYHLVYLGTQHDCQFTRAVLECDFVIYAVMLIAVLVNGGIPGEFVYFQF